MKSKIKKEQVLDYLLDKLNSNYYGMPFYMGTKGSPVYRAVTNDNGEITAFEYIDEETYQMDFTQKIPVSVIVTNGDYSVIKDIHGEEEVNGASFNATLGFLLSVETVGNYKVMLEALEQVRDSMLGNFEILKANQLDLSLNTTSLYSYLVATHCDDIQLGGELELNGKRYLEYMLTIDIDVSDNISYGNQYKWYVASYEKQWVISNQDYYNNYKKTKITLNQTQYTSPRVDKFPSGDITEYNTALKVTTSILGGGTLITYYKLQYVEKEYQRIMPLIASWGSSQSLGGFQMLRNNLVTEEDIKRAKMIHSVASARGWALTFTLQLQDTKEILCDLFAETLPKKDNLQLSYKVKAIYNKMTIDGNEVTFEIFDKLGFELNLIPQESGTSSVHGDNIVFTISMTPFWGDING